MHITIKAERSEKKDNTWNILLIINSVFIYDFRPQ